MKPFQAGVHTSMVSGMALRTILVGVGRNARVILLQHSTDTWVRPYCSYQTEENLQGRVCEEHADWMRWDKVQCHLKKGLLYIRYTENPKRDMLFLPDPRTVHQGEDDEYAASEAGLGYSENGGPSAGMDTDMSIHKVPMAREPMLLQMNSHLVRHQKWVPSL